MGSLAAAVILCSPGPAGADNAIGRWSDPPLGQWPLIPVHLVLLPDGKVLSYGTNQDGTQTGHLIYDVWDPRQGSISGGHLTLPNTTPTDLFCSAQIVLPQSGNVALLGGDNWIPANGSTNNRGNNDSNVFVTGTPQLQRGPDMNRPRWYATMTTMINGDVYVQGGQDGIDRPEVRSATTGSFRLLSGVNTTNLRWWYPRNFVAPVPPTAAAPLGRIFGIADRTMYYVNPADNGSLNIVGNLASALPNGDTSSAVMFRPGKILLVGGGGFSSTSTTDGKNTAVVIDINGGQPKVTRVADMPAKLHWATATVIPDGKVVVTGGALKNTQLVGVNYRAFIWNPDNGRWTLGAPTVADASHARLYHSNALLLPDARILVGGGGAPGPTTNTNAEFYYPPLLFNSSGTAATRPIIIGAPTSLRIGRRFTLRVNRADSIRRVTLIKTGSVTHSFNMDQRFQELRIFARSNNTLTVTAPASSTIATPGYYLLYVLNAQNVPSVGRLLSLSASAD